MSTFNLANPVKVVNPVADVDSFYGTYATVEAACIAVPLEVRALGKTVGIETAEGIIEYWWKIGITDEDLVVKGKDQLQADWTQIDDTALDYIKNKPSIPDAQIQADWEQTDDQSLDFIKNKPDLNSSITLLSITVAPVSYNTGDKYYNLSDNKIYTALSNSTWDAGVVPTKGIVYIYNNNNYLYDKGSILKIYTVKCADLVEIDELSVIEPDLNYDIIQYKLVTGATDQLLDTFTNLPEHSCTKIIEFENASGVDKNIVISTTPIVDTYYTYNIVNYRESNILLETGKRVELNLLFKKISTTIFEISIINIISY